MTDDINEYQSMNFPSRTSAEAALIALSNAFKALREEQKDNLKSYRSGARTSTTYLNEDIHEDFIANATDAKEAVDIGLNTLCMATVNQIEPVMYRCGEALAKFVHPSDKAISNVIASTAKEHPLLLLVLAGYNHERQHARSR